MRQCTLYSIILLIINTYILDMKRSEHMDVEDDVDFVQPTPPRPTPRENRKKEKQTTTSTFIDDDGFVRENTFLLLSNILIFNT